MFISFFIVVIMEANQEDNYPTPYGGETWEILEKSRTVEDGMIKYSLLVNATKDGQTLLKKYTTVYRLERLHPKVLERRKWPKFGKAKNEDFSATTVVADKPVFFELTNPELIRKNLDYHRQYSRDDDTNPLLSDDSEKKPIIDAKKSHITCRYCKGSHFTHKCPNKSGSDSKHVKEEKKEEVDLDKAQVPLAPTKTTYVPPHKRRQNNNSRQNDNKNSSYKDNYGGGRGGQREKPQVKAIKINNISVDTTKEEFEQICQQYGRTYKCNLISKPDRGYAYAFVTYTRQDNAESAILDLNGYRHDYCVWEAEWAAY